MVKNCKSVELALAGIKNSDDFAKVFTALIGDVLTGRMPVRKATAACKAGDLVLRVMYTTKCCQQEVNEREITHEELEALTTTGTGKVQEGDERKEGSDGP